MHMIYDMSSVNCIYVFGSLYVNGVLLCQVNVLWLTAVHKVPVVFRLMLLLNLTTLFMLY